MIPKPREVYLSIFPFSDLSSSKKRPVLVLSRERFNQESGGCIVCALSTNETLPYSDIISDSDLEFGSLYGGRSAVNYGDVFTADLQLLEKRILKLKAGTYERIIGKLKELI